MRYAIIETVTPEKLAELVNDAIRSGATLQGGVCVARIAWVCADGKDEGLQKDDTTYSQAVLWP